MTEPIRVLIVDDHPMWRDGVRGDLEATGWAEVVGEAADGGEAVEAVASTMPDVVLMDLQMPKMTGLEATRELLSCRPDMRVVFLTGAFTHAAANAAKAIGAVGFLLKGEAPHDWLAAIRAVAAGGTAWSATAAAALVASH